MGIDKKYQKDYKSIQFANPVRKKDKQKSYNKKKTIITIVAIFLSCLLMYVIFFSSYFSIKQVEIIGLQKVNQENIKKIVDEYRFKNFLFVLPRNSYWMIH